MLTQVLPHLLTPTSTLASVRPGDTFVALKGAKFDGRSFMAQACQQKASHIVYQSDAVWDTEVAHLQKEFPHVLFMPLPGDPKDHLEAIAHQGYPSLPQHMIAITGTNGKTSTAYFAYQLCQALGLPAAYYGTNGFESSHPIDMDIGLVAKCTTLDILSLYRLLNACKKAGIEHVCVEASSHGLLLGRMAGLKFSGVGFTNLTPEHLDFHSSMEAYFEAKKILMDHHVAPNACVAINIGCPYGQRLWSEITSKSESQSLRCVSFGPPPLGPGEPLPDWMIDTITPTTDGIHATLSHQGHTYAIHLPFYGAFQVENSVLCLLLVHGVTQAPFAQLIPLLSTLTPPAGRMELIGTTPHGAQVFVDYAHTPDALRKALQCLRPHASHHLWVVFGCGGDRDALKRPLMGAVAQQVAEHVIITDDNPRSESPEAIRHQIAAACPGGVIVADRAQAIQHALHHATAGDCILIAGKGHETGQIIGDVTLPFSDTDVILSYLKSHS